MAVNQVALSGNLTKEPDLRMAGSTPVLEFSIAVNERKKDASGEWKDHPNFFDVVVWGQRGETLARYLHKGMKVAISGRLRQRRWQANDGSNRSKVEIHADEVEFMSKGETAPAQASQGVDFFTDDIPF